jgi:hypothetical protein
LMAPVIGISLGTVIGSTRFFFTSLIGLLIGSCLVFILGALGGYLGSIYLPMQLSQAHYFAQLSWQNVLVAIIGAVLTAAFLVNNEHKPGLVAASIASLAIAYELYIPLAVAGIGLGSGTTHLFPDGLVVYAIHLAWALLFAAVTLALLGFRPLTLFGYTFGAVIALLGIIVVIGVSGASAVFGAQVALPTLVPTPTPTWTLTPTMTSTPVPPTATLTPTVPPSLTPSPTETVTPTPTPVYAWLYAPEGTGVFVRETPGFDQKVIRAYLNKTEVIILPETQNIGGSKWVKVMVLKDKTVGWVLYDLVIVATPAPGW